MFLNNFNGLSSTAGEIWPQPSTAPHLATAASAIRGDAIWRDGHCSASVRPGSLPAPEAAALKTALETAAAILRRSKGLAAKTPTKASATLGSAIGLGSRRRAKSLAA